MSGTRERRSWGHTLHRVLGFERGAVLWVPSLLAASYLVLFGIRQAPLGFSLFHYSTGLRIVLGPLRPGVASQADLAEFVSGLRQGLALHGELSIVDPAAVARRLTAVHGDPNPSDPRQWIRASRDLNARLYLAGEVAGGPGDVRGRLVAWEARDERPVLVVQARAADSEALGLALADSLSAGIFSPRFFASVAP
jgi:hypothetical protein